jgi:hypothetical protein
LCPLIGFSVIIGEQSAIQLFTGIKVIPVKNKDKVIIAMWTE